MYILQAGISPMLFGTASGHSHAHPELIYTLRGSGVEWVGDKTSPFTAGEVRFVPPNVNHGRHAGRDGFQDVFLLLGENARIGCSGSSVFQDDAAHSLENLFLLIHRIVVEKGKNWRILADQLTEAVCTIIQSRSTFISSNGITDRVMNEIVLHYSDPEFSAGQALDAAQVCPDYARRVFVRETGRTPSEVLTEKRLEYAKSLLRQETSPPRSVGEIAVQSGFFDANYFSRLFHKQTGCSPSAWRTMQKGKKQKEEESGKNPKTEF